MTMSYALFCSLCTIQDHPTIRLQVYHRTAAYIVQLGYGSGSAKCTCKCVCLTVLVLGPFWMNGWVWLRLVHLQPTDQRRVVMRMHLFLATDRAMTFWCLWMCLESGLVFAGQRRKIYWGAVQDCNRCAHCVQIGYVCARVICVSDCLFGLNENNQHDLHNIIRIEHSKHMCDFLSLCLDNWINFKIGIVCVE